MTVFKDTQHMYEVLGDLWNHVIKETEFGPKLKEFEISYKFILKEPNGYLFVDGGYVLQETLDSTGLVSQHDEYPVGFGFGLRTASPVGNVDISFGIGDKLSLRQTKVHVILNRNF